MVKKQNFDGEDPQLVTSVICLNCRKEWIAVYSKGVKVDQLECPSCREHGYVRDADTINPFTAWKIKRERKKKIEFLKAHPLCVECQKLGYYHKATCVLWKTEEGIALCENHFEELSISGLPDETVL